MPIETEDLPKLVIEVEDAVLAALDPFREKEYPGTAFVFGAAAALARVMVACLPPGVKPDDAGAQAHMEKTLNFVREHYMLIGSGAVPLPPRVEDPEQQ